MIEGTDVGIHSPQHGTKRGHAVMSSVLGLTVVLATSCLSETRIRGHPNPAARLSEDAAIALIRKYVRADEKPRYRDKVAVSADGWSRAVVTSVETEPILGDILLRRTEYWTMERYRFRDIRRISVTSLSPWFHLCLLLTWGLTDPALPYSVKVTLVDGRSQSYAVSPSGCQNPIVNLLNRNCRYSKAEELGQAFQRMAHVRGAALDN